MFTKYVKLMFELSKFPAKQQHPGKPLHKVMCLDPDHFRTCRTNEIYFRSLRIFSIIWPKPQVK